MQVLQQVIARIATPAGQIAPDCAVVTVSEVHELIRLIHHDAVTVVDGRVIYDYTKPGAKR
jgi:hypothetical protein